MSFFCHFCQKRIQDCQGQLCSCHVTYAFQSESTLYSCLNVKELLARSRPEIWSLAGCSWARTHNHLVHKGTLKTLAKLACLGKGLSVSFWTKWLWFRVQIQLDILFLSLLLFLLNRHMTDQNHHKHNFWWLEKINSPLHI